MAETGSRKVGVQLSPEQKKEEIKELVNYLSALLDELDGRRSNITDRHSLEVEFERHLDSGDTTKALDILHMVEKKGEGIEGNVKPKMPLGAIRNLSP